MLRVLHGGVCTSIQDLGRHGYASYGVPVSGVMDQYSATLANLSIQNNKNDAVLEVTYNGTFQCTKETILCISGGNLNATLNDEPLRCNHPVKVIAGSILKFTKPAYGLRAYVAIKGGFLNKPVLDSRSFFKELTKKYLLQKDDEVFYEPFAPKETIAFSHVKVNSDHFNNLAIKAYKGPEYELLNVKQQTALEQVYFTISNEHSRMGYKLSEILENDLESMLTSSVMPGTVQLTPSGTLIVLMRDCGVTGGYPRVLQLAEESINRLAQKTTNDTFKFKIIPLTK